MSNYLTNALAEIVNGSSNYTEKEKVAKVEGALIADLVDAGSDDVPSETWGSSYKNRVLFIIDFTKFKGMAEGNCLKLHISYCASSVSPWELSAYVLPKGETSPRESKVHYNVSGTHPSIVLNDVVARLTTVAEAAG